MPMLSLWSDMLDPWAYVATLRIHRARDRLRADDLEIDLRAWPAELAGGDPPDEHQVRSDVGALAQLESALFSQYAAPVWPRSCLPAHEAQKWALEIGQDVGEQFDMALRRAFFLHGHNLEEIADLAAVARLEGLDGDDLIAALESGKYRAAVQADVDAGHDAGVEGSPTVVLADGTLHHNPGIDVRRVRGLAIVASDHPSVYEEIVRVAAID